MSENGVMSTDRPECRFLVWIRDFCRGICLYFLRVIDNTNYIPEPPPNTPSEELESLTGDFTVVEVDNVDDSIVEVTEAGLKEQILSFITGDPRIMTL